MGSGCDDRLTSMSGRPFVEQDDRARATSFGEGHRLTAIDRLGTWLSRRKVTKVIGGIDGKVLADVGCGFDARFGMSVLHRLRRLLLADVSIDQQLDRDERVELHVGLLPDSLDDIADGSVDRVVMNSVLEHLDEPSVTLRALRRIVSPDGGVVFVNVPTWLGKRALELSAFRLGLSPRLEIEDHRRYYDRRQLWQELRDAGFLPSEIVVRRHKLGLNAYAVCRLHRSEG